MPDCANGWNALAKRADIILPCTTPLERDDIMIFPRDRCIVTMKAAVAPAKNARAITIFCLASQKTWRGLRLFRRTYDGEMAVTWIYSESRTLAATAEVALPNYQDFQNAGWFETDAPNEPIDAFTAFRKTLCSPPLKTPSGKIEITSSTVVNFGAKEILPHPTWHEPSEWLGKAKGDLSLHLISSQSADKLYSQLDHGRVSRAAQLNAPP